MKQLFSFIYFFIGSILITGKVYSQPNWVSVTDTTLRVQFDLPVAPTLVDSLHTTQYFGGVDTLLTIQVFVFDSAYFDAGDVLLQTALQQNAGDTLRAIAQLLLFATNSELVSINDLMINGRNGLEVGINYLTLTTEVPTLTFIQYFLFDNKLALFSIAGSKDDIPRLIAYRGTFFSSINFY